MSRSGTTGDESPPGHLDLDHPSIWVESDRHPDYTGGMREYLEGKSILLVDDDAHIRLYLTRVLRQACPGIELREASDGWLAVEQLKSKAPDLLVLDLDMPQMGGREVLQFVSDTEALALMPVLVLSGGATEPDAEVGLIQLGAWDFTEKPVKRGVLLARIQGLLRTRGRIDKLLVRLAELESKVAAGARVP